MAKSSQPAKTSKNKSNKSTVRNSRTTVSGPAEPDASGARDILAEKAAGTEDVASAFPFNPNKASEYDPDAAVAPRASVKPADPIVGASTVTELNASDKVGSGGPNIGQNATVGPLDRVRVDSTDRVLTANQGVPVADNQNSLKAGLRGPTLLEDFILREEITHFDHERIPERKQHIINAFRFELSRVQTPAVRERMVSGLMNVAAELAARVAAGLGIREMPAPMPKVLKRDVTPEISTSQAALRQRNRSATRLNGTALRRQLTH